MKLIQMTSPVTPVIRKLQAAKAPKVVQIRKQAWVERKAA